mgnify:CR=1 FL=1
MAEFKDITPVSHRCVGGADCPSIHISEDGKTYRVKGPMVMTCPISGTQSASEFEQTIEISSDLIRSALGLTNVTDV